MNQLVKTFGKEKRWVNWKLVDKKGKLTKIPYGTDGKMASSTDDATWSTYEEAKASNENVGIVFTSAQTLIGIDIDHCLNEWIDVEHEKKEAIEKLLLEADTYTEISPSGEGLHLFLKLETSLNLTAHKKAPFEVYTSGRYFTVTEKPYKVEKPVREVSYEKIMDLLGIIGYPWNIGESPIIFDKPVSSEPIPENLKDTKQEKLEIAKEPKKEKVKKNGEVKETIMLDDAQLLEKMFASKNGNAIQALYNGDLSAHKDDESTADLALCSHLAFWTRKNFSQIERIWVLSPLGDRKKTQRRQDYRTRTINAAITSCKEVYDPPSAKIATVDEELDLDLLYVINSKKDKVFTQNTENICRILRKHPEFMGKLRYDSFKNTMEIFSPNVFGSTKWRNMEDNDAVNIQTLIQILFPCFGKVVKGMVYDAMIKVAKECSIDSGSDYIRSLKWDEESRLDTWLSKTYGTPDDAYHKAVASNWMKGLVKRVIEPGCKFDYVLVLEGPQGSKKSTSLHVLGGDWHVETAMSTESKDFFMQFAGKAIVEFSEGETLSRTEVKRMKAIITMQSDKYRPPYERTSQDFPRRCVFAMTTNQTEYLKDETGNRRWLPITVSLPEADVEWLAKNRDQLLAEAYHRVITQKESIHVFPKEATLLAQEARRIQDPNTDIVADWYYNKCTSADKQNGITVHQVYKDALHGGFAPSKPMTRIEEMNIADILRSSLRLTKKRVMMGGFQNNRWFNEMVMPEEEGQEEDISKNTFGAFGN